MNEKLAVSTNPHIRDKWKTNNIMSLVVIALMPATLFGIWNFGWYAALLIVVTVGSAVLSEWLFCKIIKKKSTVKDMSAVVTGLLLALNLPPHLPLWIAALGGAFAIIVVKMLFGGLGQNFMNPALGARCFLLISFAKYMTDFNIKAEKLEGKLGTRLAYVDEFEGSVDGVKYSYLQAIAVSGSKFCIFTYTATAETYDLHKADIDAMMSSFEFK